MRRARAQSDTRVRSRRVGNFAAKSVDDCDDDDPLVATRRCFRHTE